eukprot:7062446-Pyramimonas_sp.AAC.1
MEKYVSAPFVDGLKRRDDNLTGDLAGPLEFIEPRPPEPFTCCASKATRTGFQFSRGRVITAV